VSNTCYLLNYIKESINYVRLKLKAEVPTCCKIQNNSGTVHTSELEEHADIVEVFTVLQNERQAGRRMFESRSCAGVL